MKQSRSPRLANKENSQTAKNGVRLYLVTNSAAPSSELLDHSSVATSSILPNGVEQSVTEDSIEHGRGLVAKYMDGQITLRQLYAALKGIWGKDVFDATRHNFENMKARATKGYAVLDPRFRTLPEFLLHMGPRPYAEASIHRRDNTEGYSPENCVWASKTTQSRERTNTCYLTYNGQTLPLTEWAERFQVSPQTLHGRKQRGWGDEEIILGRRSQHTVSCPADAPWPHKSAIKLEAEFRRVGGKTNAERCAFILKKALMDHAKVLNKLYSFDEYFECLTEEQNSEYNELYERMRAIARWRDRMIFELDKMGRPELISRCGEVELDRLFKKYNESYF